MPAYRRKREVHQYFFLDIGKIACVKKFRYKVVHFFLLISIVFFNDPLCLYRHISGLYKISVISSGVNVSAVIVFAISSKRRV